MEINNVHAHTLLSDLLKFTDTCNLRHGLLNAWNFYHGLL